MRNVDTFAKIRGRSCAYLLAVLFLFTGGAPARGEALASDFSSLAWTDAFAQLHGRLSKEYAFTDWKGIDWQALGDTYGPRVEAAQAAGDFEAFYLALRSYIHEIPDGRVRISNVAEIDDRYIGGGFGFAAALLDDHRVVAAWVGEASPAWEAGLRAGDELLTINGAPVQSALEAVSTIFDGNSATLEDLRNKRAQYLARAPVGAPIALTYRRSAGDPPAFAALTAYDDGKLSLKKTYPAAVVSDTIRDLILGLDTPGPIPEAMVEWKLLSADIGYIRIWGEVDADLQGAGTCPSTLSLLRQAVQSIGDRGCSGLILDLRNNIGGEDAMAAAMLGSFYAEKTFYEYQNVYDPPTGVRAIQAAGAGAESPALWIEPAEAVYAGRVIALINPKCVSSGEGVAMGIRNLPNGETLGFFGTHGSFGLCGPEAALPGGLVVHWPSGQSLDANERIQLDSRDGVGGVEPTIRIPMTLENAFRIAEGEDVELEEAIRLLNRPAAVQ